MTSDGCPVVFGAGKEGDAVCSNFERACREGQLPRLAESYVNECRERGGDKKGGWLPNLAGFFRYCGFDGDDLARLKRDFPGEYSSLCMILEDEALNSSVSPTVLSAYLKKRLGYGSGEEEPTAISGGDQLRLIFEHDIAEDGA